MSEYERPNFPYQCGRAAMWQKPCHQGPTLQGQCGGVAECAPVLNKNRWECKRPERFGGPCEEGPNPTGECAHTRLPCQPWPSLRVFRGRLAALAIGSILCLIGATNILNMGKTSSYMNSWNVGPLSKHHTKFTEDRGCPSCHKDHGKGPVEWIKAVFTNQDISKQCVNCHDFGGPEFLAHNADIKQYPQLQQTSCLMCHREHTGEEHQTRTLTSAQCNNCHTKKFISFSQGHPEFSDQYPHFKRSSIKFDHVSHLNKHFPDPRQADHAPKGCRGCHTITLEKQAVNPDSFGPICAKCHEKQILKKELVLFRLPELESNRIDEGTVRDTCGLPNEKTDANSDEYFESVSTESVSAISSFLLNIPHDDPEAYNEPLQDLILSMVEEGAAPLADLIAQHTSKKMAGSMLAGLNPEVIKRAACAWGLNEEYEPPGEVILGGWSSDLLEVRYKPSGHADPVAKAWIEFALTASSNQRDDSQNQRTLNMRDQLLSPKKGVGVCIKCHAISSRKLDNGNERSFVEWKYNRHKSKPYVVYSHKGHLDIMGSEKSCENCHILNSEVDYYASFETIEPTNVVSNFKSIGKATCTQCHAEGKITEKCQNCHVYHFKPGFKKAMTKVEINISSKDEPVTDAVEINSSKGD